MSVGTTCDIAAPIPLTNQSTINPHTYQLSPAGQRTEQTRTDGSYIDHAYDNAGQLKTTFGKESGGSTNRPHEQLGYAYDAAGNLNWRTSNALLEAFNVNNLSELTEATNTGTLAVAGTTTSQATNVTVNDLVAALYGDWTFAKDGFSIADGTNIFTAIAHDNYGRVDTNSVTVNLPATNVLAYDLNGNMLTNSIRFFEYDDENQLVRITEPGSWKSEFAYDGKMRRRIRREYRWSSGSWLLNAEVRYLYDGNLVVQERNSWNLPAVTYTRGPDLSGPLSGGDRGGFEGAGGIGGLLARTDNQLLGVADPNAHAYYAADGNGNVTALVNSNQAIVAKYIYDPYGNTLSASGPLAEANLFRFSSKEFHPNSGLIYYLYRFYDPNLQRWLNTDPIEQSGGLNLYSFNANKTVNAIDPYGLRTSFPPSRTDCDKVFNDCMKDNKCFYAKRRKDIGDAFNRIKARLEARKQQGYAGCDRLFPDRSGPANINCRNAVDSGIGIVRSEWWAAYNAAMAAEAAAQGIGIAGCYAAWNACILLN